MRRKTFILWTTIMVNSFLISCTSFLDEVPNRALSVLTSIEEYEQLLNRSQLYMSAPEVIETGTDDLYFTYDMWSSFSATRRNAYIWAEDFYEGNTSAAYTLDWSGPYGVIYYANVVLDGLDNLVVEASELELYNEVKGQALFLRAIQNHFLQEIYGQPYRHQSSTSDLGIPLKRSSELSEKISRATVNETFEQIIRDLEEALILLPDDYQTENLFRASKASTHALLSRVHLITQDYHQSFHHADECLRLFDTLLDFNSLAPDLRLPSPDNIEILFNVRQAGGFTLLNPIIDSALYASYTENDIRKDVFFQFHLASGTNRIKTLYTGSITPMVGLAIDEVYLNRAECLARFGDVDAAMHDLSKLLKNRHLSGTFHPLVARDQNEALDLILSERRKELVFRGIRWMDLRRLNQDPNQAITLSRELGGVKYNLPPNSPNYAYPIPIDEILKNGFSQNNRNDSKL